MVYPVSSKEDDPNFPNLKSELYQPLSIANLTESYKPDHFFLLYGGGIANPWMLKIVIVVEESG